MIINNCNNSPQQADAAAVPGAAPAEQGADRRLSDPRAEPADAHRLPEAGERDHPEGGQSST